MSKLFGWINRLFWNRQERRLRSGWRVLLYLLLWTVAQLFASTLIDSPLTRLLLYFVPSLAPIANELLFSMGNLILVIGVTILVATRIDRRPIVALGLQFDATWWSDFIFGLLLGAFLMTVVFLTEWMLGWVAVTGIFFTGLPQSSFTLAIWQPTILFIVVGINEELLSRGYQLRNLAEGFAFPIITRTGAVLLAWFISSILFGLLHIFNPNSSWTSTAGLMLAGLCLGLGYILTGRLGIPIGLHITWNFFQGNVYGFPVSGNNLSRTTFIQIEQFGPSLWTGGKFGPEAGLLGIFALILGGLFTIVWVRWRYGQLALDLSLADYQPSRYPQQL